MSTVKDSSFCSVLGLHVANVSSDFVIRAL